ncbi:hypothetical protein BDQ17DRAFT_1308940 [Cyathus striatus]|nr:hypothetical protein BDQ17DRAFT_1308940 [Cyathus striatus]
MSQHLVKDVEKTDSTSSGEVSESSSFTDEKTVVSTGTDVQTIVYDVPEKRGNRVTRFLQYTFFSTYRKLFTFTFFANLAVFIGFVAKTKGAPLASDVVDATAANLMVCILFRQENFVNVVYEIFTRAPQSLPIWIRTDLAKVFHYGGAHSGTGVASVVWFILYTAVVTRNYVLDPTIAARGVVITAYFLLACFLFILIAAHPTFRVKFHDSFEATHRFAGWTIVIAFWTSFMLAADEQRRINHIPLGLQIAKTPAFWFLCVITFCIILTWLRLRHRDVYPEVLSNHAIRLHFKYRPLKPFYGVRVSTRPLMEWHAFATIPDDDENGKITGYSFVVSNAGDWTDSIIKNPPKKLWIRGDPLYGLLISARLFKSYIIVATGSGIGPFLSLIHANLAPCRILWSTPSPETTYGQTIINTVLKADPKAIIWNTRERGRPDMVALTYQLVQESNAEAVFIISNPKVTRLVVYGMETRGVPAYGAIFDS